MKKPRRRFETASLAEVLDKLGPKRREKTVVKVIDKEGPYSIHSEREGSRPAHQFFSRHR
jgi:hypothetical protein